MDRVGTAYDEDFYAWTQDQAAELRRADAERNKARSTGRTSPRRSTAASPCRWFIVRNGYMARNRGNVDR